MTNRVKGLILIFIGLFAFNGAFAGATGEHRNNNQDVGESTGDPASNVEVCAQVDYILQANALDDKLIVCLEAGRHSCAEKAQTREFYQSCLHQISDSCKTAVRKVAAELIVVRDECRKTVK